MPCERPFTRYGVFVLNPIVSCNRALGRQGHDIVDTVITDNPHQDYQLAGSVRPGYLHAGELLRQQDVIVYRLDAAD